MARLRLSSDVEDQLNLEIKSNMTLIRKTEKGVSCEFSFPRGKFIWFGCKSSKKINRFFSRHYRTLSVCVPILFLQKKLISWLLENRFSFLAINLLNYRLEEEINVFSVVSS